MILEHEPDKNISRILGVAKISISTLDELT